MVYKYVKRFNVNNVTISQCHPRRFHFENTALHVCQLWYACSIQWSVVTKVNMTDIKLSLSSFLNTSPFSQACILRKYDVSVLFLQLLSLLSEKKKKRSKHCQLQRAPPKEENSIPTVSEIQTVTTARSNGHRRSSSAAPTFRFSRPTDQVHYINLFKDFYFLLKIF